MKKLIKNIVLANLIGFGILIAVVLLSLAITVIAKYFGDMGILVVVVLFICTLSGIILSLPNVEKDN